MQSVTFDNVYNLTFIYAVRQKGNKWGTDGGGGVSVDGGRQRGEDRPPPAVE